MEAFNLTRCDSPLLHFPLPPRSGCASSRKVLSPRRSASVCAVSVLIGRTPLGMHSSAAANMNASRRGAMQTLSARRALPARAAARSLIGPHTRREAMAGLRLSESRHASTSLTCDAMWWCAPERVKNKSSVEQLFPACLEE